jgi:urease accessory protein
VRQIVERLAEAETAAPGAALTLAFDARRKSRQRVRLDGGDEAALVLARGTVLRDGDRLRCTDGLVIAVRAAPETLSSVEGADALLLARAAYHLGNRHVPVEIAPGRLRYQHDHVLDAMVRGLGLAVAAVVAPFQPEGGAYAAGHAHPADGHHHGDHDHPHDHGHDHPHGDHHPHHAGGK